MSIFRVSFYNFSYMKMKATRGRQIFCNSERWFRPLERFSDRFFSRNVQRWAFWFWVQVLSCASLHSFSSLLVFWIPVFQVLWISITQLEESVRARDYWAVTFNQCRLYPHMNFGLAAQSWHDNLPTHSVTVVLLSPLGFPIQVSRWPQAWNLTPAAC